MVDDKWENRVVLLNLLEPLGFEIIEALNGREGLAKAREQHPDLIVMDLIMPVMDGLEATTQIRQSRDLKEIPIIASSASAFDFNKKDALSAGCTAFLPKPIQADDLFEHLRVHLNLEWQYDAETIQPVSDQKTDQPVVPPPREELAVLMDLAKVGKIVAIRQQIGKMENAGCSIRTVYCRASNHCERFRHGSIGEVSRALCGGSSMNDEGQSKPALLLVDDTPTNLEILVDFFAEAGFEVYIATSGEQRSEASE